MKTKVCFIGLGLIGGSIAKSLKGNLNYEIVAYDSDQEILKLAKSEGVCSETYNQIDDKIQSCDIVVLSGPIEVNIDNAKLVSPYLKKDAVLTDVGSLKNNIHKAIRDLNLEDSFVGGHPMAGTERTGYKNSRGEILENAYYILTPTEKVSEKKKKLCYDFVVATMAIPLIMTPEQHDNVIAAVSHFPHIISASLVNLVKENDSENKEMHTVAAGGFKDITRISSSSPKMWTEISIGNSKNILNLLSKYEEILKKWKTVIESSDSKQINELFESAKQYRDSFHTLSRQYPVVRVELRDAPGELAKVLLLISDSGVNIKNIGILHNREDEYGSVSIEFHDSNSASKADQILKKNGYSTVID